MGHTDFSKRNVQCIAAVSIILLMGFVVSNFKTTKQDKRKNTNPSTIETLATTNDNKGTTIRLNPAYHKKYDDKNNSAFSMLDSINFSMSQDQIIGKLGKPKHNTHTHFDNPKKYRSSNQLYYKDAATINGITGNLKFIFLYPSGTGTGYYFARKQWTASEENFCNADFQGVVYSISDAVNEQISTYRFEKNEYWEIYSAEWENCELTCLVRIGGTDASYTLSFANEEENSMNI